MKFENSNLKTEKRNYFLKQWCDYYPTSLNWKYGGMIVFNDHIAYLNRNGKCLGQLIFNKETYMYSENSENSVSKSEMELFLPSEILISGDWIECEGYPENNDSENQSPLIVSRVRLLSPNRFDSGHGMKVNQSVRAWEKFLRKVSLFFETRGFDSIKTPTLVPCPGTEPFLDSFKTEFIYGSQKRDLYLPTSPELHLKKCLSLGWDKIYEIKPCFRNGELTPIHQPEFYMLEWYRAFSDREEIMTDVINLVNEVISNSMAIQKPSQWVSLSVADVFFEFFKFKLTPQTTSEQLIKLAQNQDILVQSGTDFDEVFFRIFIEKIEPRLHEYGNLFLHSYPPSQAALARLTKEGWGDRFEVYINGIEIANAFNELNNPTLQKSRSLDDLQKKLDYGKSMIPLDEEFFDYLRGGMPPSCGIALGLDRLFMVLNGLSNINDFRVFSFTKTDNVNLLEL